MLVSKRTIWGFLITYRLPRVSETVHPVFLFYFVLFFIFLLPKAVSQSWLHVGITCGALKLEMPPWTHPLKVRFNWYGVGPGHCIFLKTPALQL